MMTLYISVDLRPSAFSSTSKFKIYAHLNHVSLLAAFGADVSPPPLLCAAVGQQWSVGGSEGICSLSTVYPLLAAWWYFYITCVLYLCTYVLYLFTTIPLNHRYMSQNNLWLNCFPAQPALWSVTIWFQCCCYLLLHACPTNELLPLSPFNWSN